MSDPRKFSLRALLGVTTYCCVTLALMVSIGLVVAGLSMIAFGAFTAALGYYRRLDGLVGFGNTLAIFGLATISVAAAIRVHS